MAQMVLSSLCVEAMNLDEKDIIDYLKGWPHSFVSGREIARKVGGKARYEEDRGWAIPILAQMVRLGLIEADCYGSFRLAKEERKKKHRVQYVAPQVLRILKESSGKVLTALQLMMTRTKENQPCENAHTTKTVVRCQGRLIQLAGNPAHLAEISPLPAN